MERTCGDTWRDSEERYGESFSNVLQPFCTACAAQDAGRDDDRRRRLDRARGTPRSLVRPKGAASGERATDSPLGGRDDVDSEDDIVGCRSLLGGAAGDRGLPGGAPAAALRPTPVEVALERATARETDLHGLVLAIDRARDDGVSLDSANT